MACTDPESFVRGGQLWQVFFYFFYLLLLIRGEGIQKPYLYKLAIIIPPVKRHLNGDALAYRWWSNIECWLGSFVIFQGIQTSIIKKPFTSVIFQGGGWSRPPAPPLGPHMYGDS